MRGLPSLILEDWSPDSRSLLFSDTSRGDTDVWIYLGGKAMPLLSSRSNEASARFSPMAESSRSTPTTAASATSTCSLFRDPALGPLSPRRTGPGLHGSTAGGSCIKAQVE